MDNTKISISDFELLLQNQGHKKRLLLYNQDVNTNKITCKPQEVIKTVCSQVKALQLADCFRGGQGGKKFNEAKKSCFISLNKLPVYESTMQEVPKLNPHKFETQCFLDTQLMNVIDGAATINANAGMTQEFDTTFAYCDDMKSENTKLDDENKCNYDHKDMSVINENPKSDTKSAQKIEDIDLVVKYNEIVKPPEIHTNIEQHSQILSKTAIADTITCNDNFPVTQDVNENLEESNNSKEIELHLDIGQEMLRPSSPILDLRATKRKLKTPPPLTVSLEAFENFENIAMPLLEKTDFETTKHLINTQLFFNDDAEILFEVERNNSPVLDFKSDKLQITSNELISDKNVNEVEKRSEVLKDEILFSSDEEDGLLSESHNLPLTCPSEIPNNQIAHLDETLYVGFHTASNKSIEISRHSYEHAQGILSHIESKDYEEFSLTELVVKCDSLEPKCRKMTTTSTSPTENYDTKSVELESISNGLGDKLRDRIRCNSKTKHRENDKINNHYNEDFKITSANKQHFNGFMTASNKKLHMSKKAFERCQKVFQGIDLNEKFDVDASESTNVPVVPKSCFERVENKVCIENVDDKINDELLLNEFENIGMSLEKKESNKGENEHNKFKESKTDNNITISKVNMTETMNLFQDIGVEITDQIICNNNDVKKNIRTLHNVNEIEDVPPPLSPVLDHPSTNNAMFVGFKTANNKEIKISDEALAKSKNVFKDIGKSKYEIISIENIITQPSTNNTIFGGFKTANNKDIEVTNGALSKMKYILKDIDRQTKIDTPINTNQLSGKSLMNKIGNSKFVKIPVDAMFKPKNIDDNSELTFVPIDIALKPFKGFRTASDKDVNTSDHSVEKNKKIFNDIIMNDDSFKTILKENEHSDINTKIDFSDDKPEKKVINKSKEALIEKSKKILPHLESFNSNNKNPISHKNIDENSIFKGFQTASKNPITVSADALAKSKIIFKDIDESNENILEKNSMNTSRKVGRDTLIASKKQFDDFNNTQTEISGGFTGFKTASNKKVTISGKALAKSRNFFDIEDISLPIDLPSNCEPKEDIFQGFQTVNKKKVEISIEALEKTKNIFHNIDDVVKLDDKKSFAGLQSASNKNVAVSEQALAASRQLFEDEVKEYDMHNIPSHVIASEKKKSSNHFVFQTGNNKNIIISEDALEKSKKLFAEFNEKLDKDLEKPQKESPRNLKDNNIMVNVDKILDTQVIHDFEQDVCSEDFKDTRQNKRSCSPILICPKAKRKKFEAPYKNKSKIDKDLHKELELTKPRNSINFREDYKNNKKYTLKDLCRLEEGKCQNIDCYILKFNLDNILNFEFNGERNELQERKMTIHDIKHFFTEGTDKKLIPDGWLDIHLKLILWKLISYEIRFPNILNKICSVRNVIDQLKYRYDKELYNAERSILRKILEKDDVPNKTMVLCIAAIYVDGINVVSAANLNNIELLLTDGWYFIKATIDNMLSKLVYDGKIVVGSKIVTCGAELVNCVQGVAPWEDTSSIRLTISGNSTHPARWDEKLGLRPSILTARLAAVRVGGGKVARLRLLVVRAYPRLYVEKLQDGSTVTRSERLEHQYQTKYEAEREATIEKIYEEVEKEMSDQDSQDSDVLPDSRNKRKSFDSGSQIAKMMKTSKDPMEFRAQLTISQVYLLQDHVSKQRDKYLQVIQDRVQEKLQNRNVITLVRGRVVGIQKNGDEVTLTKGMLSIWKPNDEVLDIFKEGSWIEVTNVVPTALRNSEIQLSAGRQSIFRPVKCKEDAFKPYLKCLSRNCYNLKDLSHNPSMVTDYNEIDTVGIIFTIDPTYKDFDSNKNQFQNVYLADIDKNMVCVNFWGGIKKFGYENILDTGQVVYCANLLKRAGNSRKNIPQFRATEFAIFTKTPKNEKGREMVDEMNKKLFGLDRRKFCQDCLIVKQNFSVIRCLNDTENITPYKLNNSDYNLGRNKIFIDTPVGVKVKNKPDDLNLTGLDFESTFRHQDTQLSPKSLERKKKVNEKIAKLKMYGEPPPLSPINIINKSKNAANSYKSPLVKNETSKVNTVSVNKVQSVATPIKLPENIINIENSEGSPIMSNILMNRTYVKRSSVNPVKLNFENVHHFAEEFDGSPPLSLE